RDASRAGLRVIGVCRTGRNKPHFDEVVGAERLHEMIPQADFIVVCVPLTAATEGMFGRREFALMKPTAGFLNFSRLRVVNYDVLTKRLHARKLGGAVLDVFEPEPLPRKSSLWRTPNLLVTPHCSSDDLVGYVPATLDLVLENAARSLSKRPLLNVV